MIDRDTSYLERNFTTLFPTADFRKHSLEYDDFLLFFRKYRLAKPVVRMDPTYLATGYSLFKTFIRKKNEAQGVKISTDRALLPVHAFKDKIISGTASTNPAVQNNRVVLIAADTVPQYLMEAGFNKIACTQPRRIACYSLAKRVGYESLNMYGARVGYQVRFDGNKSAETRVLFLTEGVLLRQFARDPYLKEYNVIIIDEVHERHLTGDFLLGILKRVMSYRVDIRLVLMSATINAALFSRYFSAPIIEIPGRMYPVTIEYFPVEEIDSNLTDPKFVEERNSMAIRESIPSRGKKIVVGPYLKILERIDQEIPESERGDLLVFVSGMNEIATLAEELRIYATSTRRWIILELHSSLSVGEQERVFDIAPEGNIAETSVTIDGIRFIIDSGKVKEIGHDAALGISRLSEFWISQSSAKQRTGRAGRTGPGACYRFYDRTEYECFNDFPVPEIMRMPLESIVLESKSLGLGDPRLFDFIERPSESSINHSLIKLSDLGCLDNNEDITDLGRVLAALPIDSVLGKMLVLGSISALLQPVLAIAAVLSVQSPFTRVADSDSKVVSKRKLLFSTHGDMFTLLNLFVQWLEVKAESNGASRKWCKSYGVEEQRMYEIVKLKTQFEGVLQNCTTDSVDRFAKKEKDNMEMDEDSRALRRQQKRILEKRKLETRVNIRKYLKLEENEEYSEQEDDEKPNIAETETVEELEFKLNNDAKELLLLTDVTSLSHRELTVIKLIVLSGLYPHIAISDEANHARPPTEQVYHTKAKRFLNMLPNSVFTFSPELLQGESSGKAVGDTLDTLHEKRIQRDILAYVQLLETTKPYLLNVVRVSALPMALLFAKRVDISHDTLHLIVDEWLDIQFGTVQAAIEALILGCWLRYAWTTVIERKLKVQISLTKNFAQTTSVPIFDGFGTQINQDVGEKKRSEKRPPKLNTIRYLPSYLHKMRETWLRFVQTGDSEDGPISDDDVMDRLVDLVDFDVDYTCSKLKMSNVTEIFSYDPFNDEMRKFCVEVTPNFNYFPLKSLLEQAERDSNVYQLPKFLKDESFYTNAPETVKVAVNVEFEETPSDSQVVHIRVPRVCSSCKRTFNSTTAEIFKHRKDCS